MKLIWQVLPYFDFANKYQTVMETKYGRNVKEALSPNYVLARKHHPYSIVATTDAWRVFPCRKE